MKRTYLQIAATIALAGAAAIAAADNIDTRGGDAYFGHRIFDFSSDADGWIAGSPGGFFSAPATSAGGGSLRLGSVNNTSTFGYWDSPIFTLYNLMPLRGDERGIILPPPPSKTFFQAVYNVGSSVSNRTLNPQFRFRAFRPDYSYSSVMTVSSFGDALYSPPPALLIKEGGEKGIIPSFAQYRQFFEQPDGNSELRFSWDILNVDGIDDPAGQLSLYNAGVYAEDVYTEPGTPVRTYDFTAGTQGFTSTSIIGVASPDFSHNANGLAMRGPSGPALPPWCFGFWELSSDVEFQNNSLYQIRFTVGSNAGKLEQPIVPTFRLRVNDSSLQASWYLNIDSTGSAPRVPNVLGDYTYDLWIWSPPALAGNTMLLSLDYLWVNGDGNDPDITLYIRDLSIHRHPYLLAK